MALRTGSAVSGSVPPPNSLVRISGPGVPDASCYLIGIESGLIRIHSESRIPDGEPVTIAFGHIQLSGIVTGSHALGDDWGIAIALHPARRREARVSASGTLTLGVVGPRGTTYSSAIVTNISQSGLGLRVPNPIPLASRVYVEAASEMILGEVRHCRPSGDGQFIAGILIVEVVPDSRSVGLFATVWERLRWKILSGVFGRGLPPRA